MKQWTQRIHDSLALGAAGILASLGIHEDQPAYVIMGGVIAVLSFASIILPDAPEPDTPDAPEPDTPHAPRTPQVLDAYRRLLTHSERELLAGKDPKAVGAWLRDQRLVVEMDAIVLEVMYAEMEHVLHELHKRSIVSSADPLWGRIDSLVENLREQQRV